MKPDSNQHPLRVGLISLGCAKNLVDAEIMLGALMQAGVEVTNDAAQADAIIVNTCSFIDAAQEESVDTILESVQLREARQRGQGVIVAGCLPQRYREDLPELFPEVDAFMGIDQVAQVAQIVRAAVARRQQRLAEDELPPSPKPKKGAARVVARLSQIDQARTDPPTGQKMRGTAQFGQTKTVVAAAPTAQVIEVNARPQFVPDVSLPRFRLTPRHFAYLKIAEGCNHPCSFCIIPRIRGSHRSRPQNDVVREARQLLADGVKELNLISQDTTFYGLDLRPERAGSVAAPDRFAAATRALSAQGTTLGSLIRELSGLRGDYWIRLLYTHPAHWTDELIETIARCPKVARYVDIPLQHIHDNMLQRMRRETSRPYIVELLKKIRARLPGLVLRTTFIVGFPGETAEYFEDLLEFVRVTRFERLGVFAYSREDGTVAGKMADQIPDKIKQERRKRLMAEQHRIARETSQAWVGQTIKVLVEKQADAKELQQASVSSWEHGLVREAESGKGGTAGQDALSGSPGVRKRAATRTKPAKTPSAMPLKGRFLVARAEGDAPDIDGRVYVRGHLPVGEFAKVRVIGHTDYDLIAEPA